MISRQVGEIPKEPHVIYKKNSLLRPARCFRFLSWISFCQKLYQLLLFKHYECCQVLSWIAVLENYSESK
ncbi:hypothetical protein NPIL_484802 [Nephila pilipes]|uniref:Uncharacterized protein n=1 Tax=Nephila pilipes TaxID=299642 RepID=A0A8X6PVE9_NEPPI|nr:hypothetical protein NPIL_484802 [Nephila pilipes]